MQPVDKNASFNGFVLRPVALPSTWTAPRSTLSKLCDALGAKLEEDVFSEIDEPSYDLALRDGWAVRTAEERPFRILDVPVENGKAAPILPPGSAVWVNTGGGIPKGVDAVIPASSKDDLAALAKEVAPESSIMRAGSEWKAGDLLLSKGTVIGAAETALLFEAGADWIKCRPLPAAGILATGSELKEFVCRSDGPTRVSSNAAYLRSLLLNMGLRDIWSRSAQDDVEAIAEALSGLSARSDFIVTIGGTGRGARDLTRLAVLAAGGKLIESLDKDCCSGGASPFIAAELNGRPVIGLPGNPLAAMMITQRVIIPMLAARGVLSQSLPKSQKAVFAGEVPEGRIGELCVSLSAAQGTLEARPVEKGTGAVELLRRASGVVKLDGKRVHNGDLVEVSPFCN